MAHIVCFVGNKGGTGKTTLTHLLAHGLGLSGQRAVAALTDGGREPLSKANRTYLPVDARTPDALARIAAKLQAVDGWFGILDGGANRPEMDERLSRLAHLVLLPFRDSPEDLRTVRSDLRRFPQAYALPSQWPTNIWQQEAANRMLTGALDEFAGRILEPVYAVSATKQLLNMDAPISLPTPVNSAAKTLAQQVFALLGIELDRRPAIRPQRPTPRVDGVRSAGHLAA
jgi:hypothetical protein